MKEEKPRFLYRYEGAVTQFGNIINPYWEGGTLAESEDKARSNLMFQYKKIKKHNLALKAKIELPGNLYILE